MWFIDIYFEEWNTTYDGKINYTWYNVDFNDSEIIIGQLLNPANLGPASSYPYGDLGEDEDDDDDWYWYFNWYWEWAQIMLDNETYDHETYSWIWFSYDIGQWVSYYDNITEQYTFLSQYVGYIGMSLFEDTNGNGVVDVSYNYDENQDRWDDDLWILATEDGNSGDSPRDVPAEMNVSESEERYLLTLDSVGNVEWGIPKITDNSAEFWICLEDIDFSAVLYASNYNWYMEDGVSSNDLIIDSHVDHLNISFSFQSGESGSSIAVKHDLADFTDITIDRNTVPAFENLSITIDYTVYYDKYTESFACYDYGEYNDVEIAPEETALDSAIPFSGEVAVENNDKNLMEMDYTMPYIWGKDGQEYENTVAITPIYGYEWMYSDAEVGQASSFGYESNSYIYSMCFNWEGYAITMDPTFMSFYIDFNSQTGGLSLLQIAPIALISALAAFGLVILLKKVKIR